MGRKEERANEFITTWAQYYEKPGCVISEPQTIKATVSFYRVHTEYKKEGYNRQ